MNFLLYWILIVFVPKNAECEISVKGSRELDVKIWEWHNSTLGIEIVMWKKIPQHGEIQDGKLNTLKLMKKNNQRVKRYENQVGSGGQKTAIWSELLRLVVPHENPVPRASSQSVWWKLLTLMGLRGQFAGLSQPNSPQVTLWSNGKQRGSTWHWHTGQGDWTAWSWSKNSTYKGGALEDSLVEGGGLRYQDAAGHVNDATWARDTSGAVTWHVQGQTVQRDTQDVDHTQSRVSRASRGAENVETKAPIASDQAPRERFYAKIQQSLLKVLTGVPGKDRGQNIAVGRKHWLVWIAELLARVRGVSQGQTPKNETPEEIDF